LKVQGAGVRRRLGDFIIPDHSKQVFLFLPLVVEGSRAISNSHTIGRILDAKLPSREHEGSRDAGVHGAGGDNATRDMEGKSALQHPELSE
jgi:hypothetical protein